MRWQTEMGRIVRYLVNDIDTENPTYDDDRIEETIVVSAQLLQSNVDYYYSTYTVNVQSVSITPDPMNPTSSGVNKEDGFINLVSLQAAMLILAAEFKDSTSGSLKVVDGPSQIDMTTVAIQKRVLFEEMKDRFNKAVFQYRAGNSIAGKAILSGLHWYNVLTDSNICSSNDGFWF